MKVYTIALKMLILAPFISSATYGQSQPAEQPKFQIEIQATTDGGPSFTVASLAKL